jgi:malic enzyme
VLCFPYIFRRALDVGATEITRSMEIAAVRAIATSRGNRKTRRADLRQILPHACLGGNI